MSPKVDKQAGISQSQSTLKFIGQLVMDWKMDSSFYTRIITWKLKCENIYEADHTRLLDTRKSMTLLQQSGASYLEPP